MNPLDLFLILTSGEPIQIGRERKQPKPLKGWEETLMLIVLVPLVVLLFTSCDVLRVTPLYWFAGAAATGNVHRNFTVSPQRYATLRRNSYFRLPAGMAKDQHSNSPPDRSQSESSGIAEDFFILAE